MKTLNLKIIGTFPLKNEIELFCTITKKVFYFRLPAHQGTHSLKVGNIFQVNVKRKVG